MQICICTDKSVHVCACEYAVLCCGRPLCLASQLAHSSLSHANYCILPLQFVLYLDTARARPYLWLQKTVIIFPIRLTYVCMNNPRAYKTLHFFGVKFTRRISYLLFIHTSGRRQRTRCMTKLTLNCSPVVQIHTHTQSQTGVCIKRVVFVLKMAERCSLCLHFLFALSENMSSICVACNLCVLSCCCEDKHTNNPRLTGREWRKTQNVDGMP